MKGAHLFQVDSVQFMTGAAKVEVAPGSVVGHVPAILANHWVIASLEVTHHVRCWSGGWSVDRSVISFDEIRIEITIRGNFYQHNIDPDAIFFSFFYTLSKFDYAL